MTKQQARDLSSPEIEEVEAEELETEEVEDAPVVKRVLSAADILDADDIVIEEVPVPEWGGAGAVVLVKAMSAFERDKFEESITGKEGGTNLSNIRAKMLIWSIVDEAGNRILTEKELAKFGKKSAKPMDRCFAVARRLSGMSTADIDDLAKN